MQRNFLVDDYVHVYNRGIKKMPIVYNEDDKWRFLKILRYFNNNFSIPNVFRDLELSTQEEKYKNFEWLSTWTPQEHLVKIIAYHLSTNHFHLLLKEIKKGGISKFMKKFGNALTGYINTKYSETGRLFQGIYKAKTVENQRSLGYIDTYIQVLNAFEQYEGGIRGAMNNFDEAFDFALKYPFCSLGESFGYRKLNIIDRDILKNMFPSLSIYKEVVREALIIRQNRDFLENNNNSNYFNIEF
ncbi:MAG: transposase [Candidatus Paceibacterota bacterium]|jgi:putative transposase